MSSDLLPKLQKLCENTDAWEISAQEVADRLKLHRSNVSRQLSRLAESEVLERKEGRPVLFRNATYESLEQVIGVTGDYHTTLQTLSANPLVHSANAAKNVLDELIEAHKEYLPQFQTTLQFLR